MNYYSLLPLIGFVASLSLGFYILNIDPKRPENRLFFMIAASLAFWSFINFLMFSAPSVKSALFWAHFGIWGPAFTAVFVLHFFISFTQMVFQASVQRLVMGILYGGAFVFSVFNQLTNKVNGDPQLFYWGYYTKGAGTGFSYTFFQICNTGCVVIALILAIVFYFRTNKEKAKKQSLLLITAVAIPLLGGILTEVLPAMPGVDYDIFPATTTLITIGAIIIAYGMRKYKLMTPLEYQLKRIEKNMKTCLMPHPI